MTFVLTGPPLALAVTLERAKFNLRVDGNDLDLLIELWLRGVIRHAENFIQRAIIAQTWTLTMDGFPAAGAIKLERPPLIDVLHVKYYDVDDTQQTLDISGYQVDRAREPGSVLPGVGLAWPATSGRINAVEIQYMCGYGADAQSTPDDIALYILAKLSEQFDPNIRPEKDTVQSTYIDGLLQHYRIY